MNPYECQDVTAVPGILANKLALLISKFLNMNNNLWFGLAGVFHLSKISGYSADSPVLWLRVDPDMQLLRQVMWEQPDYMWQYQLKFERDVVAQREVSIYMCVCAFRYMQSYY